MQAADVSREDDIRMIVAASIERGNNVSKMKTHSSLSFVNTIERLIAIYNLINKLGQKPMALTLSRVADCFPKLACYYCMSVVKNLIIVSIDEMHFICERYPKFMMCQAFTVLYQMEKNIHKHY